MLSQITVRKVNGDGDLQHVFAIRRKVFVEEQHCPADLEYANEDESHHFIAFCKGIACGAARWRKTEKGYKLERFAVLPEYRGTGVGRELVKAVLADLPREAKPVYLNAQLSAESFYSPFGFIRTGGQFEEAGIMHQQMILSSNNQK
jgi:predicted GNAT family N-acyltransferase